MKMIHEIAEMRELVAGWRRAGETVALVPTMGNLHAGHVSLVEQANGMADHTVVSIFVNPIQFGEGEDFDAYPRTLDDDRKSLSDVRVDAIFAPSMREMYPRGVQELTRVAVPGLGDILCGAFRIGHFTGVATVVTKLMNIVQPDVALFGKKDYQQLAVIRRVAGDLNIPVDIRGGETVREDDGLAMSSRNGYLSPAERRRAPVVYRTLQAAARRLEEGETDYASVEKWGRKALEDEGLSCDYFSVRRQADLGRPEAGDEALVVLTAAHLGKARLIDNLEVRLNSPG